MRISRSVHARRNGQKKSVRASGAQCPRAGRTDCVTGAHRRARRIHRMGNGGHGSARCLALAKQRSDGDFERGGEESSGVGGHLGDASLQTPNLETGPTLSLVDRGQLVCDLLTTEPLGHANLFDSTRHQRALVCHDTCVSETETFLKSFQTQNRKPAIALRSVVDLMQPDMDAFEEWSAQLGVPFEKVLRKAGVSDPDDARASRSRMKRGGAPRVRQALREVLTEYERQRDKPTEIGALMLGVEEWSEIGAELATLDAGRFLRVLGRVRNMVDAARRGREAEEELEVDDTPAKKR